MVLAVVLGAVVWYLFQKDYHPAFQGQESEETIKQETEPMTETVEQPKAEFMEESIAGSAKAEQSKLCELPTDNKWGVMLTAEDVTSDGMTLVCTQSGGMSTGELSTGVWYELEVSEGGQWKPAPIYAEVCWEDIAWIIPKEEVTQWEVNWTRIYGSLSPGNYRIVKEIMDFRQTGDFDTCSSYAYFTIE